MYFIIVHREERGPYQSNVNSSLAAIQMLGHQADNCKMVYSKPNWQMRLSLPSIKCSATPPGFRQQPRTVPSTELCSTIWLQPTWQYSEAGGAAEHLIDGGEKRI